MYQRTGGAAHHASHDDFSGTKDQSLGGKMAAPKAGTLQQKFGFSDTDLKSPNHDVIMTWLDESAEGLIRKISGWADDWNPEKVSKVREEATNFVQNKIVELERQRAYMISNQDRNPEYSYFADEAKDCEEKITQLRLWDSFAVPQKPQLKIKKEWEQTVMSNKFIVGFIDMIVSYPGYDLDFYGKDFPSYVVHGLSDYYHHVCFEVKTTIPSLGELIRQINMYREYVRSPFYIVAPDKKFISQLQSQGIGFVHYPTGEVFPHERR
jgi:hypothetical protein